MMINKLDANNIPIVAKFMSENKPEWWSAEGAKKQLSSGIGWYFGYREDQPSGWILCKPLALYKTLEIECLGYAKDGNLVIGKELQPLIVKAEEWARQQGYVNMRFTIGSRGLSCHGRALNNPWEELRDLCAVDREEYNWFLSMGFVPSGILPNIYADMWHGVVLVKEI